MSQSHTALANPSFLSASENAVAQTALRSSPGNRKNENPEFPLESYSAQIRQMPITSSQPTPGSFGMLQCPATWGQQYPIRTHQLYASRQQLLHCGVGVFARFTDLQEHTPYPEQRSKRLSPEYKFSPAVSPPSAPAAHRKS